MTALSSFRIYCLHVIKLAPLFTREMSRAPVNNCFFFVLFFLYQTVFFKNDNWRVYGVALLCSLTIVASADILRFLSREMKIYTLVMVSISQFKILV